MADAGQNPNWPIAAVFDEDFSLGLQQQVTLAPAILQDWRAVFLLLLIFAAGYYYLKGRK